jgi:phosphoglycolate phosphatase
MTSPLRTEARCQQRAGRRFDAVIFDLDGTLADTLEDIGAAMNEALRRLGQPTHPPDAYREFVGEGVNKLAQAALPPDQHDLVARAVSEFRAHYVAHLVDRTRPFPEIPTALDALVERGIKLAVLSNKLDAMTRRIVELCFGRWPFHPVFGEREGVPKKPDPSGALEIASALGVAPPRMAMVGDTAIDIRTARAAGMLAVGVTWGFRPREEVAEAGADAVVGTPRELLEILLR